MALIGSIDGAETLRAPGRMIGSENSRKVEATDKFARGRTYDEGDRLAYRKQPGRNAGNYSGQTLDPHMLDTSEYHDKGGSLRSTLPQEVYGPSGLVNVYRPGRHIDTTA